MTRVFFMHKKKAPRIHEGLTNRSFSLGVKIKHLAFIRTWQKNNWFS
jgi:hypothetical protein